MGSVDEQADRQAVEQLEERRFTAMVRGDFDDFAALAHPDLIYIHSNAVTDTLESFLKKCRSGFYVYHRVDHPISKIVISGDTAVVLGEMNADITANGVHKQLTNTALATWVRVGETWKLLGYAPTVMPR